MSERALAYTDVWDVVLVRSCDLILVAYSDAFGLFLRSEWKKEVFCELLLSFADDVWWKWTFFSATVLWCIRATFRKGKYEYQHLQRTWLKSVSLGAAISCCSHFAILFVSFATISLLLFFSLGDHLHWNATESQQKRVDCSCGFAATRCGWWLWTL